MPGQASSEAQRAGKGVRSIQRKATDSDAVQNPSVESSVFIDTYQVLGSCARDIHNTVKESRVGQAKSQLKSCNDETKRMGDDAKSTVALVSQWARQSSYSTDCARTEGGTKCHSRSALLLIHPVVCHTWPYCTLYSSLSSHLATHMLPKLL